MRRQIAFLALAITFVVISLSMMIDWIPPRSMTLTALRETATRIGIYFQRNKALPVNLNVLPIREGYTNRTTDGWKRPLTYRIDTNDTFTLSSLGRDGKVGGTGDDADTSCQYQIINGEARVRER